MNFPLHDWLLLIALLAAFVFISGTIYMMVSGELEYRNWKKLNERKNNGR